MIRAAEVGAVAAVGAAEPDAAMAAGVGDDPDLSAFVPRHDHGLDPEAPRNVVAGLGDLAFVAYEEPGAGEDPVDLLPIDVLIEPGPAADREVPVFLAN